MSVQTLEDIRGVVQARRSELHRQFGLVEIGVFGSFVRGEQDETSDIDMLVEFERPVGFFKFIELEERLGELLGRRVDLVTRGALKPYIGQHILAELATI